MCFANAEGGIILWGISNDGDVETCEYESAENLRNLIYRTTSPPQRVEVQRLDWSAESHVMAIWVVGAANVVSTVGGEYTERVGSECLPLTPERLVVRQINTGQLDASSALTPYGPDAIDDLEVERFRRALPEQPSGPEVRGLAIPELLRAIGAITTDRGRELLTVAGLLVFGRPDRIRALIPQHELMFVRKSADGAVDYEARSSGTTALLALVEQTVRDVAVSGGTRVITIGAREVELPDYPERVVREAIVNAFAHRHLTMQGPIVITTTPQGLEIENPGGFPEGITPETVIRHAPVHRNRLLCEILDRVRYMERAGLGVDRIFLDQLRLGKLPPIYQATRQSVRLRLDTATFDEPYARFVVAEEVSGRQWSVDDLLLTNHLRRMGPSDRPTLAATIQRSEDETQELLTTLTDDLVHRFGGGAATRYALSSRVQSALGDPTVYTRERGLDREYQKSLILQHAEEFGFVANRQVRDLLQVSMVEATRLLEALERDGRLNQVGARRWARYLPVTPRSIRRSAASTRT